MYVDMIFFSYWIVYEHICDPTPANEALCGKIIFELWAKLSGKVKISQK